MIPIIATALCWLAFSLCTVHLFGRYFNGHGISPLALLFIWPLCLPIYGVVSSVIWLNDFLWYKVVP